MIQVVKKNYFKKTKISRFQLLLVPEKEIYLSLLFLRIVNRKKQNSGSYNNSDNTLAIKEINYHRFNTMRCGSGYFVYDSVLRGCQLAIRRYGFYFLRAVYI